MIDRRARAPEEMNRLFLAMLMMKEGDAKKAIHSERIRSQCSYVFVMNGSSFLPSFPSSYFHASTLPIRIKLFIMRDLRRKKEETPFVFLSLGSESPSSSRRAISGALRSILLLLDEESVKR